MSTPSVQVETRGAVALLTLNRPDSANTLNLEIAMDLLAAAMTCGRNPAVRAVNSVSVATCARWLREVAPLTAICAS